MSAATNPTPFIYYIFPLSSLPLLLFHDLYSLLVCFLPSSCLSLHPFNLSCLFLLYLFFRFPIFRSPLGFLYRMVSA
ncbi:hypothetical protein BZA77DRAFT_301667 [Pyronema omphalodes]|nr:hypothetical protein BZA77DRAFT_301667 [Pyronema omphalodes]